MILLHACAGVSSTDAHAQNSTSSAFFSLPNSPIHAPSEADPGQATHAHMQKALKEAGVQTVSCAEAHSAQLQSENDTLRFRIGCLSAQLTAAQQSSDFFRKLFFCESKQRCAAVKKAKTAYQQGGATRHATTNNTGPKQEPVGVQSSLTDTDSATAGASVSTAAASSAATSDTDTVPGAATESESASAKILTTANKLRLSAETRVQELSSENASLRDRLTAALAQLEQARVKVDRQDTAFAQADKMRQRAEQHLSGVAAERNQLRRVVSDLIPEQAQLGSRTSPTASAICTDNDMPDVDSFPQTLRSGAQATPHQTTRQTLTMRQPQALMFDSTKQPKLTIQTHDHDSQISAVHAGHSQLQDLHKELESKEEVIQRQAADITDAARKMSAQQGMVQQLQAALQARELAALLFHVRLVPTRVSPARLAALPMYCTAEIAKYCSVCRK